MQAFFFFYEINVMLKCNNFVLHVKTRFQYLHKQSNKLKRQRIMGKQNIHWDDNDTDIFNWTKTIFLFIFWKNEKIQIFVVCVRFQMFYVVLRINCALYLIETKKNNLTSKEENDRLLQFFLQLRSPKKHIHLTR